MIIESMRARICWAFVIGVGVLGGCGGGGDGDGISSGRTEAATVNAGSCASATPQSGSLIGEVKVADDMYQYPQPYGVQDRSFSPIVYFNASGGTKTLQVAAHSSRRLTTPADFIAGNTQTNPAFYIFISALDTTTNQLLANAASACTVNLSAPPAGQTSEVTEDFVFNLDVPAGHTVVFTDTARVLSDVGTTGATTIETVGLDFTVTEL
jgi:hypothetical protein